jgi:hypothetical protein
MAQLLERLRSLLSELQLSVSPGEGDSGSSQVDIKAVSVDIANLIRNDVSDEDKGKSLASYLG